MTERFDVVALKATMTEDGYLHDTPVLTRTGIFEYRDPMSGKVRREFRPSEEVFHADSLASLRGKPITNDHPGLVKSHNVRSHSIGTVLTAGRQDGENLLADIVIHDTAPIQSGKRELSLGYQIDLDETPGEWNGQRYDAIQRNIRLNHLAVVKAGRAGNARLNLDSADLTPEEPPMAEMTLSDVRLDSGITYKAAPEVAHAFEQMKTDLTSANARADAARAEADGHKAALDAAKADAATEIAKLRADAARDARARMALEAKATELKAEFKADATDLDIKAAVIRKVRGDALDLSDKSPEYIAVAYDLAVEAGAQGNVADQRRQMVGDPARQDNREDGLTAYQKHVRRLENSWKGAA